VLNKLIAGILIELVPYVPSVVEQLSKSISDSYDEVFNKIDYNLIKELPDKETK